MGLWLLSVGTTWGANLASAREATVPLVQVDSSDLQGAECISATELQRRVERRRGALRGGGSEGRHVQVRFDPAPGDGFTARVQVRAADGSLLGKRLLQFSGARCRDADETLVLVIGTLYGLGEVPRLEPESAQSNPDPAGEPSLDEEPEASSRDVPEAGPPQRRVARPPSVRVPWRLQGALGAALSTGVTPVPAPGLVLGLDARRTHWGFALEAQGLPRSRASLGAGAEALLHGFWMHGRLCVAAARWARARMGLCAGARAGLLRAATRGLGQDGAAVTPQLGLTLGPHLTLGAEQAKARVFATALFAVPLVINALRVDESEGITKVYHEDRPGLWLAMGVCWGRR